MNMRLVHVAKVLLMTVGGAILTASCSNFLTDQESGAADRPARTPALKLTQRIVQLHFGRDAAYAICVEPACPTVTPKTIAATEPIKLALTPVLLPAASGQAKSPETFQPPTSERVLLRFASGATALDKEAKAALDQAMPLARKSEKIIIKGRTDDVGAHSVNQTIALARALQVRNYLRSKLKDVDNVITIDAKGACCFISDNDIKNGRQENRRVELVFTLRAESLTTAFHRPKAAPSVRPAPAAPLTTPNP